MLGADRTDPPGPDELKCPGFFVNALDEADQAAMLSLGACDVQN